MDFGKLFEDAGAKAQEAIDSMVKVGVPAIEASLEQWGIDTLKAAQKESQGRLNEAVKQVTATDPAPGSFGAALNATVQGTVLQTHGVLIICVVLGLIIFGFILKGK